MWPVLLDMTEEESVQNLRHLELEAYSALVSALRAQGFLSPHKRRILRETSILLNISHDRHKTEIRRAINDEKLNTIAYHISGHFNSLEEWAQEGRRPVPLLPRSLPQTTYSVIADEISETASQFNKQLPFPSNTERKRPVLAHNNVASSLIPVETNGKNSIFRVPDVPLKDEIKRRRCHSIGETSSLAQHLLSPKLTKIQQIYRQSSKKYKANKEAEVLENSNLKLHTNNGYLVPQQPPNSKKLELNSTEEKCETRNSPVTFDESEIPFSVHQQIPSALKQTLQNFDHHQVSETNKILNKNKSLSVLGQKVIVVTNAQTVSSTNSILQKTLSVPMNKLTKINIDKLKLLSNNTQLTSPLPSSVNSTNQNIKINKSKLVAFKGNSSKKVIPLAKLQMLKSKVVPYVNKSAVSNQPLSSPQLVQLKKNLISNSVNISEDGNFDQKELNIEATTTTNNTNGVAENGEKLGDLKDSLVEEVTDNIISSKEIQSLKSSETEEIRSNGESIIGMEINEIESYTQPETEVVQEFEVLHTDELLQ